MSRRWRTPSPAIVVSLIALFVALGGTTYAATSLPKNSVGAAQLKKNAVTSAKVKKGSITGAKVKVGSLLAIDFKAGQLPAGGITGLQTVKGSSIVLSPNEQNGATANCPAGKKAVSGGWDSTGGTFEVKLSKPTASNAGWQVIVDNNPIATDLTVYVVCANAS